MVIKANSVQISFLVILLGFTTHALSADPPEMAGMLSDCDSGLTQACINVGAAYTSGKFNGKKITVDKSKAKHYIDKAVKRGKQNCLQGDSADCYTLGLLFFEGAGIVPTDIPRGLDFLQRSCNGGYKKACAWLDNSGLGNIR